MSLSLGEAQEVGGEAAGAELLRGDGPGEEAGWRLLLSLRSRLVWAASVPRHPRAHVGLREEQAQEDLPGTRQLRSVRPRLRDGLHSPRPAAGQGESDGPTQSGQLVLLQVTVVGIDGRLVYESLVCPEHDIIDFNTRFSGITAKDLGKQSQIM